MLLSSGAVAFGIISLLPVELILQAGGAAQVLGGLEYRLKDAWSLTAGGKLS